MDTGFDTARAANNPHRPGRVVYRISLRVLRIPDTYRRLWFLFLFCMTRAIHSLCCKYEIGILFEGSYVHIVHGKAIQIPQTIFLIGLVLPKKGSKFSIFSL